MKVFSNIDYDKISQLVSEYFESQDINQLLNQLVDSITLPDYLWQLKLDVQIDNIDDLIDELYGFDSSFIDEDRIIWVVLLLEALHSVEWALKYALQAKNSSWLRLRYKTALLLDLRNEIVPAINLCKKIIVEDPDYQVVYTLLGSLSAAVGNTEDSLNYYSMGIHLNPSDYWVRHSYAVWCINLKDFYTAIDQLQVALELNPTSSLSWFQLAQAYHLIGDIIQSEEALKKAKELGFDIVDSFG
jgi:tetratricopeptide (TPR) repeat protein